MLMKTRLPIVLGVAALAFLPTESPACTRAVYLGPEGMTVTGRTMDWREDPLTNLYIFPRGTARRGANTDNTVFWTSKYGTLSAAGYDIGITDGMNEAGLVANLLFLPESVYERPGDTRPVMGLSIWTQYVLDNFATVDEAVAELSKEKFRIDAPDRFVRASFYINAVVKSADPKVAVPAVMSVMRNVSVPYGISTPDKPHIASTRWRTVCDQKNRIYYFEPTLAMETFWVDLSKIDFGQGTPERVLKLVGGRTFTGDATAEFRRSDKPFVFLFGV